jgi:hypothetical protein
MCIDEMTEKYSDDYNGGKCDHEVSEWIRRLKNEEDTDNAET